MNININIEFTYIGVLVRNKSNPKLSHSIWVISFQHSYVSIEGRAMCL